MIEGVRGLRLYTEHAHVDYRADSCSFTHFTSSGGGRCTLLNEALPSFFIDR